MKRLFTLIIMIIAAQTAIAQSATETRRWEFGAMLGPQVSFLVPRQDGDKPLKGVVAGLDVGYRFQDAAKGWSVHLQPYFSGFRGKGTSGVKNSNFYLEIKSKIRSFNTPLLFRYTFSNGKIRPFAELGAQCMVASRFSYKISGMNCPEGAPCEPLNEEQINQKPGGPRITALASAGVQIDVGKVTIPITIRLVENVKKQETYDFGGVEYKVPKSRVVQLTAGVTF
ncbi:outer membrane beta-barrel protein [Dyadobacter soli]|nr:outer membrane beta-barrel protein [Dyadobacter soli]